MLDMTGCVRYAANPSPARSGNSGLRQNGNAIMSDREILFSKEDGIGIITLNRFWKARAAVDR